MSSPSFSSTLTRIMETSELPRLDDTSVIEIGPIGDRTVQLQIAAPRPDLSTTTISEWALRRYRGGYDVLHSGDIGGGSRLNTLFEARCDRYQRARQGHKLAVQTETDWLTYPQLDQLANQTARYLANRGVAPGDRVGLLFDRSIWAYVSMLAVAKLGAAYVPMDKQFPVDRIQFIAEDAGIDTILSVARFADLLVGSGIETLYLDQTRSEIEQLDSARYRGCSALSGDDLCYIIYTSGSTGRPKGVPITHANIANFVEVAAEVYGLNPDDRVYQGLTLAFDFAVEEIWVPLIVGATLVPAPSDITLIGPDLHEFLRDQRVTALCCVPTLLATIDGDLLDLTFLLVSGEACPDELANRWHRAGRRFLNVYGPTEATVTATWTELTPEGKVTIGGPLPTYSIVILDPEAPRCLDRGDIGEIGIAGPGLAPGYLNRDDKTAAAFIDDFIGIENNPSGRIYRTGDLGRINELNEIEYLGRIDTQVKIRGYRIELDEISSALLEADGVAQAVVIDHTPASGATELAAYYTLKPGATATIDQLKGHLQDRMPPYMVPSTYTELDELPMLPSQKVDRRQLPEPSVAMLDAAPAADHVAPRSGVEEDIAAVFASVLGLPAERVSSASNFFDDLGASSLLLAHVCTALRADPRFADVSVKDLYVNPTIGHLASALGFDDAAPGGTSRVSTPAVPRPAPHRPTRRQHIVCGLLQALWLLTGFVVASVVLVVGGRWVIDAPTIGSAVVRSAGLGWALFAATTLGSVAAKWILIGRWKAERIPVWSFRYFRYWAAKGAIRFNPMRAFAGSPLYNTYLRLMGVKIGRNVSILSTTVPVCTDLIRIGDDVVIRSDSSFTGHKIEDGWVVTGPVKIGSRASVGEASVLDVDTRLGSFATLGHRSTLLPGQRVPHFATWHGSPAEPTDADYRPVPEVATGLGRRRAVYSLLRAFTLAIAVPTVGLVAWLLIRIATWFIGTPIQALPGNGYAEDLLGLSLLVAGAGALALVLSPLPLVVVPRVVGLFFTPGKVYKLYGLHYMLARLTNTFGNSAFHNSLLGDSAVIVPFLRMIGYDLDQPVQTGVNFGLAQRQGTPVLCRVGQGTMVSDGLTMANFDFSATGFSCSPVSVGRNNFLGNDVLIPADAKIGDNVLLATKVLVPVDGEVRSDVGLLGSPAFEIPRSSSAGDGVPDLDDATKARRLSLKLRANVVGMAGYIGTGYLGLLGLLPVVMVWINRAAFTNVELIAVLMAMAVVLIPLGVYLAALIEWFGLGFRRLEPQQCSIFDPYYWYHERHWKWARVLPGGLLVGTPFRPMIWRLLGVRMGKRVVDEGVLIPERTLTAIGDDACLNERSTIQGHSLEDGAFKSDYVRVGDGCTIGTSAFVHYGTTIEDGAILGTDAFLLKGETIPTGATWAGNPAGRTEI